MTRDRTRYFHKACEVAPFRPERTGERDLLSTESFSCSVRAFEPGQRYEPHDVESADTLHAVLHGRGSFVVGESRQVLQPGDVVVAPAGLPHRAFANQGERLVLLVVTGRSASPAAVAAAESGPEAREKPEAAIEETPPVATPSVAAAPPWARRLPGLTVPVPEEPAEVPPELPVARPVAPPIRTPRVAASPEVRSTSDISRILDSLRSAKDSSAAETAPVIPDTKRCAPSPTTRRASLGASETSRGSDWLPEIFRKPAVRGATCGDT